METWRAGFALAGVWVALGGCSATKYGALDGGDIAVSGLIQWDRSISAGIGSSPMLTHCHAQGCIPTMTLIGLTYLTGAAVGAVGATARDMTESDPLAIGLRPDLVNRRYTDGSER